jgi:hypothetical protein
MGEQVSGNWRKATYSGNGETCVEVGNWRKASYSANGGQNCVEVARDGAVLVRDTTNRDGGTLAFRAEAWQGFLADLK